MNFTFLRYEVEDNGVLMEFVNFTPGAGLPTNYVIRLSDTELAGVSTQVQLRNLVISKLQRKIQAAGISSKLDQFVGQSVAI